MVLYNMIRRVNKKSTKIERYNENEIQKTIKMWKPFAYFLLKISQLEIELEIKNGIFDSMKCVEKCTRRIHIKFSDDRDGAESAWSWH